MGSREQFETWAFGRHKYWRQLLANGSPDIQRQFEDLWDAWQAAHAQGREEGLAEGRASTDENAPYPRPEL